MIGFVGFGRMGRALANGAIAAKALKRKDLAICDPHVKPSRTAAEVVKRSNLVFLCVKPQKMAGVMAEIADHVGLDRRRRVCFVSIAAGIPLPRLQRELGAGVSVVRVMPNTPALLRAGVSGMSIGKHASAAQISAVKKILKGVGDVVEVPERLMDAVTALSGSGPAYAFYLAEAMSEAAKEMGVPAHVARVLVHQTLLGAGRMLVERGESASDLRMQVTSPNGTTAAAIKVLDDGNAKQLVVDAVRRAAARAAELANA